MTAPKVARSTKVDLTLGGLAAIAFLAVSWIVAHPLALEVAGIVTVGVGAAVALHRHYFPGGMR